MFTIIKSSRYVEYGLQKGDIVYIAGEMMTALTEKDPYLYRKLFIAAPVLEGHVQAEDKPLSMDGINLKAVSKSKQKKLYAQFEKDFAKAKEVEISESTD
jgi:hypothetical protein